MEQDDGKPVRVAFIAVMRPRAGGEVEATLEKLRNGRPVLVDGREQQRPFDRR